jgi:catalase (peroxidase I)
MMTTSQNGGPQIMVMAMVRLYSYGFGTVQETYRIVDGRGGAGFGTQRFNP